MIKHLMALPLLTWSYFFYIWYKEVTRKKEQLDYYKRNNCVITFAVNREIKGSKNIDNVGHISGLTSYYSPLLDFLKTTRKSLDIAMMTFSINILIKALKELKERGIRIRIIVDNFESSKNLRDSVTHVKWNNNVKSIDNIFHNKYIIRDYDEETCAVLNGSLNFTMQGVYDNYEDVIITTNGKVAENMQQNFDELWKYFPLRY